MRVATPSKVKLARVKARVSQSYWWFRYLANNKYNNFLADHFPKIWFSKAPYISGIRWRWKLYKLFGMPFKPVVWSERSKRLFMYANIYLTQWELASHRKWAMERYLKKADSQ